MREKVIDYSTEERFIQSHGEHTTEVAVLMRSVGKTETDGSVEAGQVYRHFVVYDGEIESATTRRSGVRTGPVDIDKLLTTGQLTITPEPFTTPAKTLAYPRGTRAEIIRPTPEAAANGATPILRIRVPLLDQRPR